MIIPAHMGDARDLEYLRFTYFYFYFYFCLVVRGKTLVKLSK